MTGGTVDVEVISELKESDSAEKVVLLSADSLAKEAYALCIYNLRAQVEVWVSDCSGCYSPGALDIDKGLDRFIQVTAVCTRISKE